MATTERSGEQRVAQAQSKRQVEWQQRQIGAKRRQAQLQQTQAGTQRKLAELRRSRAASSRKPSQLEKKRAEQFGARMQSNRNKHTALRS